MPYAIKSDMQARYGDQELMRLTDIATPRAGAIVDSVLNRALDDASAWIDSYLIGRYPVPITDTSALATLRMHACAEARYLLMTVAVDEAAVKQHEERAKFFMAIAKGDIDLMAPANVPVVAGVGPVLIDPGQKVFGRDSDTSTEFTKVGGGW